MQKVLIANRGEIAVRIIRACHDLGLKTVAVYSKADHEALHVLHADEAICIGEAPSSQSYLKVPALIAACEITGADAVHPGYGFLSENANFAQICKECGINFIGPSVESISLLGNKAKAKEIARRAGVPTIPGSIGCVLDVSHAKSVAKHIGYPLMIKASAGGGGKGIRIVDHEDQLESLLIQAQNEAKAAFGDSSCYLEKKIEAPRHIEIQIIADSFGNIVHLGERDCTIQRRRQKLIEESPSPILSEDLRNKMGAAAVAIAKEVNYTSLGTVEFLVDGSGHFYFMEVNTRVQVEHTVTEEITGRDLVQEQINIANGKPLSFSQNDVEFKGHVLQLRINAEDPSNQFRPSPGKIEYYLPPGGPNVRVDSACYAGCVIPPHYDAMIAKLIVKGSDRNHAVAIAKRALREFHVGGIHTTIGFQQMMMENDDFLNGDYDLTYLDKKIESDSLIV